MKSNPELSRIWTGYPRLRQTLEALTPTDTRQAGQVRLSMETEKVRGAVNDLQAAQDALGELKRAAILPGNPRGAEISAAEARVAGKDATVDDCNNDGVRAWRNFVCAYGRRG